MNLPPPHICRQTNLPTSFDEAGDFIERQLIARLTPAVGAVALARTNTGYTNIMSRNVTCFLFGKRIKPHCP